ncbi:MAG: hypothetical protein WDA10_14605 [Porticoccaceae bacterium]
MKFVISIFLLPYEIDDLSRMVNQLKLGANLLSGRHQWVMDVNLCLADDMVDWGNSSIDKQFFVEKLNNLARQSDWCEARFTCIEHIKGCVSQRRKSLLENPDADHFIWIDGDIFFSERTITFVEQAAERLSDTNPMFILTPEVVRLWDSTWDCLVNEQYISKPLGYQAENDPFTDSGIKGKVSLELVNCNVKGQPRFKFAGGWFTCLSAPLLNRVRIPETFGHYGLEDTFIMHAAEKFVELGLEDIKQFKLKNAIVCENYKFRDYAYLLNRLSIIDRRVEFKKISELNFRKELDSLH